MNASEAVKTDWEKFVRECYPDGLPAEVLARLERAFFAGLLAGLSLTLSFNHHEFLAAVNAWAKSKLDVDFKVDKVEKEADWIPVAEKLPPEGMWVETKIHVPSWDVWCLIRRRLVSGKWENDKKFEGQFPPPTHWHL